MHLHRLPLPPHPSKAVPLAWIVLAWLVMATGLPAQSTSPAADAGSGNTPAGKPVFEEWVLVVLDGKQCGFGSTLTTETDTPGGPQFHTVHEEQFVVKRLSTNLTITQTSKITEDADGGVLDFEQISSGMGSEIKSTGLREGDDLVVSSRGETQRYHMPRLDALGPEKVRRLSDAVPLKPGQPFSFNTFASEYPQSVVVQKGSVVGQETRNVRGVNRKVWKLTSEVSMMPGLLSTYWVDDQGNDVEALTVIPGIGDLHEYVTDRASCMAQMEGAEVFAPTLIHPQRAIPSPGDQAQAVYRLTLTDPTKQLTLWDEGEQRILSTGPGFCEIEVTAEHITPDDATWQLPHDDTPALHPYLQASAYLEVNSPEIQALAKQAVGNEKNPVLAAHFIENFVREYITKKDLNIGFASAEETAKSREGDCTEHAVLCAAIGRAAGLPTRCVVGLGYIPPGVDEPAVASVTDNDTGIFGFHMWAEAWIGPDKWVPMDAALNGFDVGHIAIAKTALEEINPLIDLNTPIMDLMQNLKIDVLKTVPKATLSLAPSGPVATPENLSPAPTAPSTPPTAASSTPSPASAGTGAPLD